MTVEADGGGTGSAATGADSADGGEARLAQARELAAAIGLAIDPTELAEVAARLDCLLIEMRTLDGIDLEGIDPVALFPEGAW